MNRTQEHRLFCVLNHKHYKQGRVDHSVELCAPISLTAATHTHRLKGIQI